jgi:hypothetical protein
VLVYRSFMLECGGCATSEGPVTNCCGIFCSSSYDLLHMRLFPRVVFAEADGGICSLATILCLPSDDKPFGI